MHYGTVQDEPSAADADADDDDDNGERWSKSEETSHVGRKLKN